MVVIRVGSGQYLTYDYQVVEFGQADEFSLDGANEVIEHLRDIFPEITYEYV